MLDLNKLVEIVGLPEKQRCALTQAELRNTLFAIQMVIVAARQVADCRIRVDKDLLDRIGVLCVAVQDLDEASPLPDEYPFNLVP